jgi:transposase
MVAFWRMKAYSQDLRQMVVHAVERVMSKSQAARWFGISLSSVRRYSWPASQGEFLTPKKEADGPLKRTMPQRSSSKRMVKTFNSNTGAYFTSAYPAYLCRT